MGEGVLGRTLGARRASVRQGLATSVIASGYLEQSDMGDFTLRGLDVSKPVSCADRIFSSLVKGC